MRLGLAALVLGMFVLVAGQQRGNTYYDHCVANGLTNTSQYFFELTVPRNLTSAIPLWPLVAPASLVVKQPLADLYPSIYTLNGNALNYSQMFETIIIRVNSSYSYGFAGDACEIAAWYTDNLLDPSCTACATFVSDWKVLNVSMGYTPVKIPEYLRNPLEPNTMVFWVQGVIGAVIMVVQIAYQLHNHFGTDFRHMEEAHE